MKLNPIGWLLGGQKDKKPPVLLAVTPPRTGERTLLGVENLLQSIAVPEPFSLELAGDADGVTLMARCRDRRGGSRARYRPTIPRPASRMCPTRRTPCALTRERRRGA